jgi:hypothetical protein
MADPTPACLTSLINFLSKTKDVCRILRYYAGFLNQVFTSSLPILGPNVGDPPLPDLPITIPATFTGPPTPPVLNKQHIIEQAELLIEAALTGIFATCPHPCALSSLVTLYPLVIEPGGALRMNTVSIKIMCDDKVLFCYEANQHCLVVKSTLEPIYEDLGEPPERTLTGYYETCECSETKCCRCKGEYTIDTQICGESTTLTIEKKCQSCDTCVPHRIPVPPSPPDEEAA